MEEGRKPSGVQCPRESQGSVQKTLTDQKEPGGFKEKADDLEDYWVP